MTTHYMEEAVRLCDRVAIMDHGKIIALGTPAELVESLGAHEVIEFSVNGAHLQQEPVRALPGVRDLLARDGNYILTVEQAAETMPELFQEASRQRVEITQLATHRATLEDVFLKRTGRVLRDE